MDFLSELKEMELLYISQSVGGRLTYESGDISFEDGEIFDERYDLRFADGTRIFFDKKDVEDIILGNDEFDNREIHIFLKSGVKWVITKIK